MKLFSEFTIVFFIRLAKFLHVVCGKISVIGHGPVCVHNVRIFSVSVQVMFVTYIRYDRDGLYKVFCVGVVVGVVEDCGRNGIGYSKTVSKRNKHIKTSF